jgi:hypothetical protein
MAQLAPYISILALCVSVFTAWFTILRRGSVCSTHPSFIAVRYDFVDTKPAQAKIFLRTLLFSTGKRGWVIESLFLRVREGARSEEFAFWGYGDKDLVRGSGLFVPENGVVTNHHFNPLQTEPVFVFSHGTYQLELVAQLVGRSQSISLWKLDIEVPRGAFDNGTIARDKAVFFSWSPDQRRYIGSIETRSESMHALSDPRD